MKEADMFQRMAAIALYVIDVGDGRLDEFVIPVELAQAQAEGNPFGHLDDDLGHRVPHLRGNSEVSSDPIRRLLPFAGTPRPDGWSRVGIRAGSPARVDEHGCPFRLRDSTEMGRESCRERVCQNV